MRYGIIGLPRTGTAWLSTMLTFDKNLCLHEFTNRSVVNGKIIDHGIRELRGLRRFEGCFTNIGAAGSDLICQPFEALETELDRVVFLERDIPSIVTSCVRASFPGGPESIARQLHWLEERKRELKRLWTKPSLTLPLPSPINFTVESLEPLEEFLSFPFEWTRVGQLINFQITVKPYWRTN